MEMRAWRRAAVLGMMAAGTIAQQAQAGSFYLTEQSIKAAGRASSGEAADQGSDSLWWNPAAIGGATHVTAAFGAMPLFANVHARNAGTLIVRPGQPAAPVGGVANPRNPAKFGAVPNLSLAVPLNDRIALGIAVTSPFSFATDYQADSWTRYVAGKTRVTTVDIQPSLAVAVTDQLRVGIAANVDYTDATLAKALPNLLATLPDGRQALKGNGWDLGWSAGAQYVADRVSIGLSYKSSVNHKLDGTITVAGLLGPLAGANGRIDTQASFRTPWQAIGAVRLRASDRATLNLQVVRFGWSKFDRVRITIPAGAFIPEDYRDTWSVAGGVDYALSPALTVRGGMYRDQTPTRNGKRDPNVPDANRTGFALGATQRVSRRLVVDVAAEYVAFDHSSIDRQAIAFEGTPAATAILTNGRLSDTRALDFGIGVRLAL